MHCPFHSIIIYFYAAVSQRRFGDTLDSGQTYSEFLNDILMRIPNPDGQSQAKLGSLEHIASEDGKPEDLFRYPHGRGLVSSDSGAKPICSLHHL